MWCGGLQLGEPGHRGPQTTDPASQLHCGLEANRRRSARQTSSRWGTHPQGQPRPESPTWSSRVIQRSAQGEEDLKEFNIFPLEGLSSSC